MRTNLVSRRVSTAPIPIWFRPESQLENFSSARQLDCSEGVHFMIIPIADGLSASLSSEFAPVFPICGNVNTTACPA